MQQDPQILSNEPTGPLTLIEAPMRMFISQDVQDSPHRFIKQLSKSVAPSNPHNSYIQPRIPLGPISSAIFGNTRDNRGVHELRDLRDNNVDFRENHRDPLDMTHNLHDNNRKQSINGRNKFHDPLGVTQIMHDNKREPCDNTRDNRDILCDNRIASRSVCDTVVCLHHGKPFVQTITSSYSDTSNIERTCYNQEMTASKYIGLVTVQSDTSFDSVYV